MYLMLLQILSILLNILWWIIIVQAVMSWLIAFNVINTHNDFVRQLWQVLERITEPLELQSWRTKSLCVLMTLKAISHDITAWTMMIHRRILSRIDNGPENARYIRSP